MINYFIISSLSKIPRSLYQVEYRIAHWFIIKHDYVKRKTSCLNEVKNSIYHYLQCGMGMNKGKIWWSRRSYYSREEKKSWGRFELTFAIFSKCTKHRKHTKKFQIFPKLGELHLWGRKGLKDCSICSICRIFMAWETFLISFLISIP